MSNEPIKLSSALDHRKKDSSYRQLPMPKPELIDFSSNDYLGLSRDKILKQKLLDEYSKPKYSLGSTGSRLLTGNSKLTEETEEYLSGLFQSPKSLIFSSGYLANLAFFSTVPQRGDTIVYDELSHACIKDGSRLSLAKKTSFRHNDLEHLEVKLRSLTGNDDVFVAVESIYSMDGDSPDMKALVELCNRYEAKLVVDEAHSTGILGTNGNGMICELDLQNQVYARIMTFGKALGCHGACICGSITLHDYLVNFARPFIYTTAPGAYELLNVTFALDHIQANPNLTERLREKQQLFQKSAPDHGLVPSKSAIQAIIIPGNDRVKSISRELNVEGFDVRPILSPTVQSGFERLRICLHTFNSDEDIRALCKSLKHHFSL